jgi:hypothetical protein
MGRICNRFPLRPDGCLNRCLEDKVYKCLYLWPRSLQSIFQAGKNHKTKDRLIQGHWRTFLADSSNRIPRQQYLGPQSTCPLDRGCKRFGTTHPVQLSKYHSGNCSKRCLRQHRTCLTTCLVRKIDKRKRHLRPTCLRMFRWGNSSRIPLKRLRVSSSICHASRACNSRTNRQQPASSSSPSDTTYSCWA